MLEGDDRVRAVAAIRSKVRAQLLGCSSDEALQQLRGAEDWHHQVSKVVLTREDELRVETTSIEIDEIQAVLTWLLNHPTADHYNGETIPGDE